MSLASVCLPTCKRQFAVRAISLCKTSLHVSCSGRYPNCRSRRGGTFCPESSRGSFRHDARRELKSRRSSDGQFRSIGIRRAQNQGLSGVRGEERPLPDSVGEGSGSTLAVPATAQHTAAEKQPSEQPRFNSSTKGPPKAPHAVAMEEFVALERKLVARAAPATTTPVIAADGTVRKKRKSAEEVAMEEFMALERKIGLAGADASKRTEQGGSSKAVYSSMERPKEPEAEECCGNGCANCVWISYWEDLQAWEERERAKPPR